MDKNYKKLKYDSHKTILYMSIAILFWTIFNLFVVQYNINKIKNFTKKKLITFSQEFFQKDLVYQKWNLALGNIYGEVNEFNKPNPFLKIKEKNITTPSGKQLTMINPAYMTRQVHEIALQDSSIIGHITSLNPIRPENKADEWEKSALEMIINGKKEFSEITSMNDRQYFRYIAPLFVEESCLKCHQYQGYKLGDLHGGISVSIPYKAIERDQQRNTNSVFLSFGMIWFLGTTIILVATLTIKKEIREREILTHNILKSEKDYRQFFDKMLSGCIVLQKKNDEYLIKTINNKAIEIDNLNKNELINKPLSSIFPYETNLHLYKTIDDIYINKDSLLIPEQKIITKKGQNWREIQIFTTDSGNLLLVYNDKTQFHKNENHMLILQRAVEQSTSLITITNLNGNLEYANPMFLRTTGYSWNEIKGQHTRLFKSGEQTKEFYNDMWQKIVTGETWYGEFHNKAKDGKLYWESSNISPIFNKSGELTHFVKIGKDITDTKLAIDSLKESESRYRNLVESSYDAMLITDEDEILYFNHSFEILTGYKNEELFDKTLNQLIVKSKLRNEILGTGIRRNEAVLKRADSTMIDVEIIKTTIDYLHKKNTFLIIRDITKQKHVLNALKETIEKSKSLDGLIPICASCKNIRDEEKEPTIWVTPEEYIHERLPNVDFTHSICPSCLKSMYPELYEKKYGNKSSQNNDL